LLGVQNTLKDISNISFLLFIFVFTYMLIGMELYAFKIKFNENNELDLSSRGKYPQSNFNTPLGAFLSVFIVLANDGWAKIYFDHFRVTSPTVASLFFISILFIGQFMLLNLFIAILIENFEQLSVRGNLTHRLNAIVKKSLWRKIVDLYKRFRGIKVKPDRKKKKFDHVNNEQATLLEQQRD